jgi:hypothetical protein
MGVECGMSAREAVEAGAVDREVPCRAGSKEECICRGVGGREVAICRFESCCLIAEFPHPIPCRRASAGSLSLSMLPTNLGNDDAIKSLSLSCQP